MSFLGNRGTTMDAIHSQTEFSAMQLVQTSKWTLRIAIVIGVSVVVGTLLLGFLPWQQNIAGAGRVVAYLPLERQQSIDAPIGGRIVDVHVQEGSIVNKGDLLLVISDLDPQFMARLEQRRQAIETKLTNYEDKVQTFELQIGNLEAARDLAITAARFKIETGKEKIKASREKLSAAEASLVAAESQYERKTKLFAAKAVSERDVEVARRDLEIARTSRNSATADLQAELNSVQALETELDKITQDAAIKINDSRGKIQEARSQAADARESLAKIEGDISKAQTQRVTAPIDGTVLRLSANLFGQIVKSGDKLLEIVPQTEKRAVELWVDGNDAPLLSKGDPVRLQFEGWPAVQFAGWPSVAVGTFGGRVDLIDSTDNGKGKFRILILPDADDENPWPGAQYLRQGVRTKGWVLLNEVSIGYEIWRQLNGFPPVVAPEEPKDDIARKRVK
ncbi:MAG: HlyD family efflux transporter periplasmic adaptor subunit [Phycisphaerales bacterium]|nr:HlyD family efflux transporter periplasmic adaptor subunit [Phycisphaerales bacterium]MCB9857194.1 HlyD family efflux transporter periplasmic adaptor subunit [Phycisphaerales bacterium]MCB9863093.1 HlyD family efflux transporter periplasmic adaptor subunit [Phycisphaerales bacterium]